MLNPSFFQFLAELSQNNYKEWFHANKKRYIKELKDPFAAFIGELLKELNLDTPPKDCIFRINRDIRFSKDKSPYKTHVGAIVSNGGRKENVKPGFYIQIEQSAFHLGGGCYVLPKQELLNFRMYLIDNYAAFLKIINDKAFVKHFGGIKGEKNKRLPKELMTKVGDIPHLLYKQMYFMQEMPIDILLEENAINNIVEKLNSANKLVAFLNKAIENKD